MASGVIVSGSSSVGPGEIFDGPTRVPTGPPTGSEMAAAIRRGMVDSATSRLHDAQVNYTSALSNPATTPAALENARLKLASSGQNYNESVAADPSTRATLDTLNANRASAFDAMNAARNNPELTADERKTLVDDALKANKEYGTASAAALRNGGTIPGSPTNDPGIPVVAQDNVMVIRPEPMTTATVPGERESDDTGLPGPQGQGEVDRPDNVLPNPPPPSPGQSADQVLADLRSKQGDSDLPLPAPASPGDPTDGSEFGPPIPKGLNGPPGSQSSNSDVSKPVSLNQDSEIVPGAKSAQVSVPDHRIRLTPKNMAMLGQAPSSKNSKQPVTSLLSPLLATQGLMFPYTPTIQYSGLVNYGSQAPIHSNQDYKSYTGTPSTTISISGTFTAQTHEEGLYLLACLHFLRTVTKMRFGQGSGVGLPPPVLVLNGYGNSIFYNLPVIILTFQMELPNNVDYINVTSGSNTAWVPVHTNIVVTCNVQNTPNKLRTFNWDSFAKGELLKQGGWS